MQCLRCRGSPALPPILRSARSDRPAIYLFSGAVLTDALMVSREGEGGVTRYLDTLAVLGGSSVDIPVSSPSSCRPPPAEGGAEHETPRPADCRASRDRA